MTFPRGPFTKGNPHAPFEPQGGEPEGPAGGDLEGTYPNPIVGLLKITGLKIANNSINGNSKLEAESVTSTQTLKSHDKSPPPPAEGAASVTSVSIGTKMTVTIQGNGVAAVFEAAHGLKAEGGEILMPIIVSSALLDTAGTYSIRAVQPTKVELTAAGKIIITFAAAPAAKEVIRFVLIG